MGEEEDQTPPAGTRLEPSQLHVALGDLAGGYAALAVCSQEAARVCDRLEGAELAAYLEQVALRLGEVRNQTDDAWAAVRAMIIKEV